jgi:hypothetical protein
VDGTTEFYFSRLDQTTAALRARLSYTVSPTLSFQVHAQPFVSAGEFSDQLAVVDPKASTFERRFGPRAHGIDPDFNFKQFRSNAVLRWEYRPGSTLFVVWNSDLHDQAADGSFDLVRDTGRLFRSDGTNVLLLKLSYWFDL